MEFDTHPHHCGSHRTETPTPGTCSPVESRDREGAGVSLQKMHPGKVQLMLKSNTKASESFVLTLLDPQNPSPLQLLFPQPGHPWARTERVPSKWKYTFMRPGGLAVCLSSSGKHQHQGNSSLLLQVTQQRTRAASKKFKLDVRKKFCTERLIWH